MSRKTILRLACEAVEYPEETVLVSVLGDAVLEHDWYDAMMAHAYNIDEAASFKLAAAPTLLWARCVGSVLMCGAWQETLWQGTLSSMSAGFGHIGRTPRIGIYSFGLPTIVVPPFAPAEVRAAPETSIRGQRLTIMTSAPGLMITRIRIANQDQIAGGAVQAETFSPGSNDHNVDFPTMTPANSLIIGYLNTTDKPITVSASVRGVGVGVDNDNGNPLMRGRFQYR